MPSWTAISTFVVNQVFGKNRANEVRGNLIVLASLRRTFHLGGSRVVGVQGSGAVDAQDYVDIEIDGTNLAGLTAKLRVEVRTFNAATSVTPKLRNLTTAADVSTGAAACTATNADYSGTNQKQELPVTLATGVNKYRLMLTTNNATHPVFGIGYLEVYVNA